MEIVSTYEYLGDTENIQAVADEQTSRELFMIACRHHLGRKQVGGVGHEEQEQERICQES